MSLIKYKKRILIFGLAVSLLMPFSLALAEEKKESFEELSIKLRALQVAGQVEEYLKNNPDLTIKELQVDLVFKRIAVQRVGETGYTAIVDVNSGYFYFHPQEALVNTDTHALKGNLSNWWEIIRQTIGDQCRESSGLYNWQEDDGSVTEKYMYLACVDGATADGKNLFVGATAYLDEYKEIGKTAVENKGTQVLMAREGLLNNAKNVAEKIELVVNGFSRDIRSLSQTIGIRNLLSQVQQEGILTNTETEKKFYPADKELYWQNVYEYFSRFYSQNMDEIDAVRLFDKNGYIVCGSVLGEEDVNDYKGDKSWFRDVMNPAIVKNNEVYVSPINIANRTNSPALRYIVPIEMNGERLGLVIINFKANAVYSDFNKENNIFFLDKAYENSEGEITTDWVVVLADSRNPSQTLDESRSAASLIGPDQIASNSGYLEFLEEGREWAGAYQKVNVLGREWYVVSVLEKDLLKTEPQTESEKEIDLAVVIYWLFGGLAAVFLILFIFHRFGITTIEKNTIFYLLGAALLIIIVLFIFSTWQITQSMKNETKRAATEALEAVAVSRAEHVNTLLDSYKIITTALAVGNVAKDTVDENINYSKRIEQAKKRIMSTMEVNLQITRLRVLDKNGELIISNIEDDIIEDVEIFTKAKEKIHVGNVRISAKTGQKVINVSSPIYLGEKFAGVLVATFDFEEINKIVDNRFGLGETGEIYLVNKEKYTITPLRFATDTFLKQKIDTINIDICFQHAEETYKEHGEIIQTLNFRGVNIVGAHSYLSETQWCLLAEKDEQEIMANVNKNISRTWYFTLSVMGLIMFIGIVLNFLLIGSLKKEIEAKTVDIKNQSNKIKEQLRNEEKINKEKEMLLKEQKVIKDILESKIEEMEKFQKLTIGRELKMIELKEQIIKLKKEFK